MAANHAQKCTALRFHTRARTHQLARLYKWRMSQLSVSPSGFMSHNNFGQHSRAFCFREKARSCLPSRLVVARESHLALLGHDLGEQLPNGCEPRTKMHSISPSQPGADTPIDTAS